MARAVNPLRLKVAIQFVVSNLALVANFALSVILARILSPEDVGVFSMSAVLIGIAHVFRDFGVTAFLKQEKTLTQPLIRGAIGLLVACSWLAGTVMFLTAEIWAEFFREPRVVQVVQVLALGFFFIPFGAIPQAILMRDMDVAKSAWVTGISTMIYFAASIIFAMLGFKHMTMAWANLLNILVSAVAYNVFLTAKISWRPTFYGWKEMMGFGSGNLFSALLRAIDTAFPDLVLGKLSSPQNVGLLSRANSTVNMIGTVIHPTVYFFAVPFLAKTHHQKGSLNVEYLRGGSIINCLILPALVWVSVLSVDVVRFLYGEQWIGAASAIPWLGGAIGIATFFTLTGYAVTGIGRPHLVIFPLLITLLCKVVLVAWLFDGTLSSFAMCIAIGQVFSIPSYVWINRKYLQIPIGDWLGDAFKALGVVGLSATLLWLVNSMIAQVIPVFIHLVLMAFVYILIVIPLFWIFRLPIWEEISDVVVRVRGCLVS